MTRDITEEMPAEQRKDIAAANEEFTGMIVPRPDTGRRAGGWDPYEVWRTRVRSPAKSVRSRKDRPLG